jgi:hypothetical protein
VAKEGQHRAAREHSRSQSQQRERKTPGSGGRGNYYHIEVRDGDEFETFRTQDVGDPGHLQRVSGKRASGSWATVKWLVSKQDAHVEDGKLVGDTKDVKDLLKRLRARLVQIVGDRFEARDRRNVRPRSSPTPARNRAQRQNARTARPARS